jgi:hypothetical protein
MPENCDRKQGNTGSGGELTTERISGQRARGGTSSGPVRQCGLDDHVETATRTPCCPSKYHCCGRYVADRCLLCRCFPAVPPLFFSLFSPLFWPQNHQLFSALQSAQISGKNSRRRNGDAIGGCRSGGTGSPRLTGWMDEVQHMARVARSSR